MTTVNHTVEAFQLKWNGFAWRGSIAIFRWNKFLNKTDLDFFE